MKVYSVISFLSLALAISVLAKNNNHNNNNAKANATDQVIAASGVNDAANNGAKGDAAAALAQEAVDEFEAGQAVTTTAADGQASANVGNENAVIAGRSENATANAGAAAAAKKKAKGEGKWKAAAQNNAAAGNSTASASANNAAGDQLVAASGVNNAAKNGARGGAAAAIAQEAVDEFEAGLAVTATAADAQASANVAKENAVIKKAGARKFRS